MVLFGCEAAFMKQQRRKLAEGFTCVKLKIEQ
jgi:hypothetical protein